MVVGRAALLTDCPMPCCQPAEVVADSAGRQIQSSGPNQMQAAHHAAGAFRHLVKLINAADALVAEYQRSTLQHCLPRLWVLQAISNTRGMTASQSIR